MDLQEGIRILQALEREGVRYVLVGSMAMAVQGLVRATRGMDFFVAPDSENIELLRRALKTVFDDDPNLDQITAEDLGGDYPAVEYVPPNSSYSLDILARLGEAFRYEEIDADEVVIDGVRIRVATPGMLYRIKRDTVRPQDRVDAEALRERFDLREEE
jgi:hypothetical protein